MTPPSTAPWSALALVLCALTPWLDLDESQGDASADEAQVVPTIVLENAAGEEVRRPLAGFESEDPRSMGGVLVRFEGLGSRMAPLEGVAIAEVELAAGGKVHGRLLGGEGESLDLSLLGATRLRLSVEEIAALRLHDRIPEDWSEPVVAASEGDRLYRAHGAGLDRIDGTLELFSAEGVRMETELGSKLFPWDEIAALFIEVLGEDSAGAYELPVVVDLVDGGRLPVGLERLSAEGLFLISASGRRLRLPLAAVAEFFLVDHDVSFLSDLEPSEALATSPFGDDLGMVWPARMDLSTSGNPLRAGGRVWSRGIGGHAPSRLQFTLDGTWKRLRGQVAIDDEVIPLPASGSALFRILAGERVLWESPVKHGGDAPTPIPALDIEGVTNLVLEVAVADEMHIGDRADWLRVILSR